MSIDPEKRPEPDSSCAERQVAPVGVVTRRAGDVTSTRQKRIPEQEAPEFFDGHQGAALGRQTSLGLGHVGEPDRGYGGDQHAKAR